MTTPCIVQTFRTTLWASGGNNVGIVVPEEVVRSFGRGKRLPVVVTVNGGHCYRTTIGSRANRFLISFNAATRAATGLGAGDEVDVRLNLDDAPRVVEVPQPLAEAFTAHPSAAARWATLSYSKQQAHALAIEGARTGETRARRVQKVIDSLA